MLHTSNVGHLSIALWVLVRFKLPIPAQTSANLKRPYKQPRHVTSFSFATIEAMPLGLAPCVGALRSSTYHSAASR